MMLPFTPHLGEEIWHMIKCEGFASLEKWPSYDENKIDKRAEAIAELIQNTRKDIIEILRLGKIEKQKKITLFVADKWKYDFMDKLKDEINKSRNIMQITKSIMSTDLKIYGNELTKLIPKLVQDETKLPQFVLGQDAEFHAINDASKNYEDEFKCKVEVTIAENSNEAKAKQSMPFKVAILVE